MLTTLRITGFAVVDQVEVRFGSGLQVLTGETGAGKSLLVGALHLVLGGRMSADVLREGADEASVEALFELPAGHPVLERLEAAGLPPGDAAGDGSVELLVRRVVTRAGRGRVFVNGALCTVSILESAMRGVVDVTGQHEHVSLLDAGTHLGLLDAFAGVAGAGGLAARYGEAFGGLAALAREERELAGDEGERARRADYLRFQLDELEAADPRPDEDVALEQERRVLGGAARLADAARAGESLASSGDGSAAERLAQAIRALQDGAALDPRLGEPLALLRSAAAEVDEAGRALSRYADGVQGDPERLSAIDDRLALLRGIARKHGGALVAALARREEMRTELSALSGADGRRGEVARALEAKAAEAVALAADLGRERQRAARAFSKAVARELERLAMGRCRVEIAFAEPTACLDAGGHRLAACGAETAEIRIAPNPGEPARPLARVASGGELSRVLLAVKRALSRADPVLSYVFDEVDAGIGGAVAEAVGRALAEVARERQVICVTHLPQVAAFADAHCRVEKRVAGGRTSTTVVPLVAGAERCAEVARMLAGQTVTSSALDHAAALIAAAHGPDGGAGRGGDAPRRATPGRRALRGSREVARA